MKFNKQEVGHQDIIMVFFFSVLLILEVVAIFIVLLVFPLLICLISFYVGITTMNRLSKYIGFILGIASLLWLIFYIFVFPRLFGG